MDTLHMLRRHAPILLLAAFAAAACVDENSGNGGTPPGPTLDETFVGYSNPTTRQTTCGNCHIDKQRKWSQTGHARAWEGLQASGHAAEECYSCHTTGGYSNAAPDSAGYFTADSLGRPYYQDVQCEACHGPGAGHIAAPDDAQPLSTIQAAVGLDIGCGTCHSGFHNSFVEEWSQSRHGEVNSHATSATCLGCHSGQAALARFDSEAHYLEQSSATLEPISCAVCHDPHGSGNPAELRRPINERDLSTNLCMQCHNRQTAPSTGSSRGNQGHGTQGGVLLGVAGWIPPGFTYDTSLIESSHGSTANPRLCAGCHVENYSVTTATGTFFSTGHRFLAIPCVDATTGLPDSTQACTSLGERRFAACAVSGCHPTQNAARGAFTTIVARTDNYANTLWRDVDGDQVIDAFPADSGLLPTVKAQNPTAINPSDATITVGDGAEFNVRMFGANLAGHPDGSHGVHNPFYYEALLIATIQSVRSTYNLPAPPSEVRVFAQRSQTLGMNR